MLLRQREFSFCRTRTLAPTKVASHDQGELASIEDPFLLDRVALAAPPCGSDRLRRASPMTLLLPPSGCVYEMRFPVLSSQPQVRISRSVRSRPGSGLSLVMYSALPAIDLVPS